MRKNVIISALVLALAVVCGCVDEPSAYSPEGIPFGSPKPVSVVPTVAEDGVQTRGSVFAELPASFKVWGYVWRAGGSQDTPNWLCGETFTKEGDGPAWVSATPHGTIPSGYKVRLWSVHPADADGLTDPPTAVTSGAPSFSYAVPSSVASHADLLVAHGEAVDAPASTLPLTFTHILAGIEFRSATSDIRSHHITSITVSGVRNTATYVDGTGWTSLSGSGSYTITPDQSFSPSDEDVLIGTSADKLFLLPQTLSSGATLTVIYEVQGEQRTKTASLAGVALTEGTLLSMRLTLDTTPPVPSHPYVDLGLRRNGNKILFATMNLGASSPEEYGDFFAWGETSKRYTEIVTSGGNTTIVGGTFEQSNCPHMSGSTWTKYSPQDDKMTLESSDDVATALWGGSWHMPDLEDFSFLLNTTYCSRTWTANYNSTGVAGMIFTGKGDYSENSIFLPAAGRGYNSSVYNIGSTGMYWSRTRNETPVDLAYYLSFGSGSGNQYTQRMNRFVGLTVRPVLEIPE